MCQLESIKKSSKARDCKFEITKFADDDIANYKACSTVANYPTVGVCIQRVTRQDRLGNQRVQGQAKVYTQYKE